MADPPRLQIHVDELSPMLRLARPALQRLLPPGRLAFTDRGRSTRNPELGIIPSAEWTLGSWIDKPHYR